MESELHLTQLIVLLECLKWWWRDKQDFFAAGNLSIYYRKRSPKSGRMVRKKLAFHGPDFFVVLGARPRPPRNSWVVEDEDGKFPNVIVEVLSKSTSAIDRGKKKTIYQNDFKTPEYFLYDPVTTKLEGYRLKGARYAALPANLAGRLRSEQLGLLLGVHEGRLRFFTPGGKLVPLPAEVALAEQARAERAEQTNAELEARAEQERTRAERAEQKNERLLAKLRALGIDPESLE